MESNIRRTVELGMASYGYEAEVDDQWKTINENDYSRACNIMNKLGNEIDSLKYVSPGIFVIEYAKSEEK